MHSIEDLNRLADIAEHNVLGENRRAVAYVDRSKGITYPITVVIRRGDTHGSSKKFTSCAAGIKFFEDEVQKELARCS